MEHCFKNKCSTFVETLKLNGTKYDNVQDSKQLLVVHKYQLYVWHNTGCCILSIDIRDKDADSFQTLLPTNPPVFEVECLVLNRTGTLLALYGHKGVMVMQVPKLYDIHSSSSKCQNSLFCWSSHVAERFYMCSDQVTLLQVAWHPGSPTCTHLVTLSSDNYLRLYEATDSQTPLQAIRLAPANVCISSQFRVSFPECYGESPVSFDFGCAETAPARKADCHVLDGDDDDVIYPVYVLNANGDVYVVKTNLKRINSQSVTVEGPLPMFPPAEDNYGADACSLLCLHTNPPVLVIAVASGVLYHCILLSNTLELKNELLDPHLQSFSQSECSSVALYVHGSVELPVTSSNEESEDSCCHPIRLHKDTYSNIKYHCSLVCGVYTVAMPFMQRLEESVKRGNHDCVVSLMQQSDSTVEHLLCTRPLPSLEPVPVIGLATAVINTGAILISLLASWDFECLPMLASTSLLSVPSLLTSDVNEFNRSYDCVQRSFEEHILHLLQRSTCAPILRAYHSADDGDIRNCVALQQWLELVSGTTHQLKKDYIDCLSSISEQICHRKKVLTEHKTQQLLELRKCVEEKALLQNNAERLAVKYDEACVNQQMLLERIEKTLKVLQHQLPVLSVAEVSMKQTLTLMEGKLKSLQVSLEQIKKKMKYQTEKMKEYEISRAVDGLGGRLEGISLGQMQLKHIKEILHKEGEYMADLVKTVITLREKGGS